MSRLYPLSQLIFFALCGPALAQGDMIATSKRTAAAAYVGPGDVVPGWTAWWGVRAYNAAAASAGAAAIKVFRSSDSTAADIHVLANGNLDTASYTSFCNATTCVVQILYDQTGNGHGTGAAAGSPIPTLNTSCQNSHPCIQAVDNGVAPTTLAFTLNQPISSLGVAQKSGSSTTVIPTFWEHDGGAFAQMSYLNTANGVRVYGGTVLSASATDGVPHVVSGVLNGASSSIAVDGTLTSGNAGTNGISTTAFVDIFGQGSKTGPGNYMEVGLYSGALSTTNQNAVCRNQAAYWNITTTC